MNRRTLTTKRRPPAKATAGERTHAPASAIPPASAAIDEDMRSQLIAEEAYFFAERRGFTPGCELDDWLAAEAIVEDRLRRTSASGHAEGPERAPGPA